MIATIEISHYPLKDDYEGPILTFINALKTKSEVKVWSNGMSSYIQGEWFEMMKIVTEQLYPLFENNAHSATILKIVPRAM